MSRFGVSFVAFVVAVVVTGSKLNVPKVLLPYQTGAVPVSFTLEISDSSDGTTGCFHWKSSNPEIVEVRPIYDDTMTKCASRAIVSAVSKKSTNRMAMILAEDMNGDVTLKCDVMVDAIQSLEIVTTTKKLYLKDSPELFIVRAKNERGDTFADLDGLVFDWTVETAGEATRSQPAPARIVSFSQSEYETTEAIRRLESERFRGDRILVAGVSSGIAIISVQIRDDVYRSTVQASSIRLTVMAQLILEPSADLWVPVGSQIGYSLRLMRYKKAEAISISSSQYRIMVESVEPKFGVEIARFDEKTSKLEALAVGTVRLVVDDIKLETADVEQDLPSAYVYVVEPVSIRFVISTGNWIFEIGRSYEVTIELLDAEGRALFIAENIFLDVIFPTGLLKAAQVTAKNGTVWLVEALKEGSGSIVAKYDAYLDRHGIRQMRPVIDGEQSFEIYHSMAITPSLLVFPTCHGTSASNGTSASSSDSCYEHRLVVHGGSGQFVWLVDAVDATSSSAKITVHGIVGRQGLVSTSKGDPAAAVAIASDVKNRNHKAKARIAVTDPVNMEFVDGPREVELGSTVRLGLRLHGKVRMSEERLVPITDCRRIPFDVRISNEAVLKYATLDSNEPDSAERKDGDACASFSFQSQSLGDTVISVVVPSVDGSGVLTANVSISVYAPLKVISPADKLLITPTSSYPVVFTGGPAPLQADPSSRIMAVERLGKTGIDYFETSAVTDLDGAAEKRYMVTVSCLSGTPTPKETSLLISVGNNKTATNKFPALSTAKVNIVCDFPTSMSLRLRRKRVVHDLEFPPCSLDLGSSSAIPVHVKSKFDLLADVSDKNGRKFHNASALLFTWRVSDSSMLRAPGTKAHALHSRTADEYSHEFYETFQPLGVEGDVKVTAEVTGIVPDACSKKEKKSCEEYLRRSLKTSAVLRLVPYASITPSIAVLYDHPKTKVIFTIDGGSEQFFIPATVTDNAVAIFRLIDDGRKVEAKPGGAGSGESILSVYDACLIDSPPAQATIVVSSIEKLILIGPSLIMLGNRLTLRVQALDKSNRQFEADDVFSFLPLDVFVEGPGLTRRSNRESSASGLSFDATDLGTATVFVSVIDPSTGNHIRSAPHRVQIFPSLEVEPKSITLIAGARFQLRIAGGLQYSPSAWFIDPVSSGVAFTANDSKVITISPEGLIEAKRPGVVSVVARLANPEKSEILAEDAVMIRVVQLASAKIFAPVTTIYAGSTIPLAFIGYDHPNPRANIDPSDSGTVFPWGVGSADIPLKLSWTVDGDGAEIDVSSTDQTSPVARLHCTKKGVVQIRLAIEQPHPEMAKLQFVSGLAHHRFRPVLNASLTVTVREVTPIILMSHGAKAQLKLDSPLHRLHYRTYDKRQLIDVAEDGNIQATSNRDLTGSVAVVSDVRADISDFDEAASAIVSVRPVAYMMASGEYQSLWKEKKILGAFPVSYTLKLAISYHDRRGLRFDAVKPSNIHVRPNRFDLVDISVVRKGTVDYLHVHLKNVGETIIKIWNSDHPTAVFEYLRIVAVQAIKPASKSVEIGQKISFSSALSDGTADDGFSWTTSDPNVLAIDSSTGFAVAKAPGQSTVSQTLSGDGDKFTTSTLITVAEPISISMEKIKGPKAFVDGQDGTEAIFAVKFHGTTDGLDELGTGQLALIGSTIKESISLESYPFTCELQISPALSVPASQIFRIEPAYVSSIGFGCILEMLPRLPSSSPISMEESSRNVSVWAKRKALVSETLTYPIYPPIATQPSTEVFIDNVQSPKAVLRILAPTKDRLDHVKVALSPDAQMLFKVSPKKNQDAVDVAPKKEYVVWLRSDAVLDLIRVMDLHMVIIDETTDLVQKLPIRLKLFAKTPTIEEERMLGGIFGFVWDLIAGYGALLSLIGAAILAIVGVNYGQKFLANRARMASMAATTPAPRVSPSNIQWRSYGVQGMRSPQSPRLWSVDTSQRTP